ncbi:hypothetical protein E4T43_01506 [Aureobasidium subglaciale]|nr:hypothetical protein E4T43_01506 [Aureobasidium subglaciale]
MPMNWNATADAKLFTAVMVVYDVKISGAQVSKIAQIMGDDCTAKAITHRLSKLKNGTSFPATSASATPKTPASSARKGKFSNNVATPSKSGKGKGSGLSATHTITTLMHDENEDDEEDFGSAIPAHPVFGTASGVKKEGVQKKRKLGIFETGIDGEEGAVDYSTFYTSTPGSISAKKNKTDGKGKGKEDGAVDSTAEDEGVKIKTEEAEAMIIESEDEYGFAATRAKQMGEQNKTCNYHAETAFIKEKAEQGM